MNSNKKRQIDKLTELSFDLISDIIGVIDAGNDSLEEKLCNNILYDTLHVATELQEKLNKLNNMVNNYG